MIHPRDFDGKTSGWRFRVHRIGSSPGDVERFSLVGDARIQKRRFGEVKALAVKARRAGSRHTSWLRLGSFVDLTEGW